MLWATKDVGAPGTREMHGRDLGQTPDKVPRSIDLHDELAEVRHHSTWSNSSFNLHSTSPLSPTRMQRSICFHHSTSLHLLIATTTPRSLPQPIAYLQYVCNRTKPSYLAQSSTVPVQHPTIIPSFPHRNPTCSTSTTTTAPPPHPQHPKTPLLRPITSMPIHLTPRKPYSVPYLVARWLNQQQPRPAGTIAKLAILSKSNYLKIVPILYSTLVLGGDHEHHCLQISYANNIFETIGVFRMARDGVQDGTFFNVDNEWYNTTRRLYILSVVRCIHLDGPLPTQVSCDIVSTLQVNVFSRVLCIVFGPRTVTAIGTIPRDTPASHLDPPYTCISKDKNIISLNKHRPVWLNAIVAISRPRRLYVHFHQMDWESYEPRTHDNDCQCCSFADRMWYLGPPYQWQSLEQVQYHGIVDQIFPVILSCRNIYIYSAHLKLSTTFGPDGRFTISTRNTPRSSLSEMEPGKIFVRKLPGPSWYSRIANSAHIHNTVRQHLAFDRFAKKAYSGQLPQMFEAEIYRMAGHVDFRSCRDSNHVRDIIKKRWEAFWTRYEEDL